MAHQHQVNASGDDVIGLPITIEAGADSPPSDVGACSDENIGGGRKEGTASLWRPLRKALGVTSQARRHRSRDDKYGRNMAIPELDDDEGEDEEGLEEKNNGGDLSSSMVLDIDGNGDGTSAGGKKSPFRLPDYVQARSVHNLIPALISDEEEEGLELLAHAVAADNRAAEVEAAEAYAAAEGDGRNAGTRQPLLMGSLSETQRVSSGVKEEGQHSTSSTTTLTQENGNTTLSRSKALPTCPKAGRKVLTAKQQHVRTLTLPKQGQTMEMELALKDLLRYIQNAVRAVHVSQQQQFSINLSQNAYVPPFSTGGQCKEDSVSNAANSFNRKGMLHSRTMSTGNNESIMMGGGGPVTRMPLQAPPALVGGLLNARDVRRLVSGLDTESVKSKEMSIAVRRHTIVLSLDIIRCLILWDRIIVVVPDGAESNCFGELERNLRWLRVQQRAFDMGEGGEEEEEFEFLALEAVLMTINNHFRNRLKDIRPHIIKNSKALLGNGTLNTQLQDTLRQLKSQVANHQAKVRSLHKAIFALLDDEEHLQMLHLTRIITNNQNHQQQQQQHFFLQNGGLESVNTDAGMALGASEGKAGGGSRMGGRNSSVACGGDSGNGESNSNYEQQQLISTWLPLEAEDNDEAEILLESFLGDFNELIIKWELVKEDMQNTENYVTVKLDMARNKLLTIGTLFALVNLCFAFGALVSGIFGMNLYNGVSEGSGSEDSFPFFVGTISFIVFMMTVITGSVLAYMYMSRIIVT
ncbi:hypothetical protein VYU27_005194 [Nannochloropsis oceanica]